MDSLLGAPPSAAKNLCDLPLPPLSEAADEAVRRARAYLFGVSQGGFWVRVVLEGYTESTHRHGVFLFSTAIAERPFGEWRQWRALRPPRDPDLPELVSRLNAFKERWMPRALESVSVIADEGDRAEVSCYIGEGEERASRTWTVKAFVQRLRGLQQNELYRPVWEALVAQGILDELPEFDRVLADVQEFIRMAPLKAEEISEIQRAREDAASELEKWLADRKAALAHVLDEADLLRLGLGDLVPPPFHGPSAFVLQKIEIAARA